MADTRRRRTRGRHRREWLALALLVPAASCVPEATRLRSAGSTAVLSLELPPAVPLVVETSAPPLDVEPAALSLPFEARSAFDRARALECLAEAVYYEARSESEQGQRAVAQTVLNRVRHPAYPDSVCGVVYQGPMRPGGGCQFTFTCDGSLARRPVEPGWSHARRIAAEALAGKVYAPARQVTHYHTLSVAPDWAPALSKAAVIGAHIFYRMPGAAGAPSAFTDSYSGREPNAVPFTRRAVFTPPPAAVATESPRLAYVAPEPLPQALIPDRLPQSRVRPEYLNSGRWKTPPADVH